MTSKLTRDIIQSEIADFFAGVVEIHTELGGPNSVEEAQNQLTERVLACVPAVDSEPVAYIDKQWTLVYYVPPMSMGLKIGDKLYRHAQPAPEKYNIGDATMRHIFTPTGMTNVSDMQAVFDRVEAVFVGMEQPAPVVPDGYVMVPKEPTEAMMLHNSGCQHHAWDDPDCAMRQTRRLIWSHMLAAAPYESINALIPLVSRNEQGGDRWILVSERMPEVGVKVLCFPVKDEPIHATFNGQLWLQDVSWSGSEEPIDNVIPVSVTHWMPLPAGPQEVKGE